MSKKIKAEICCGHGKSSDGSWDPGTTYKGVTEAGLMKPITKALVKYMRLSGVEVCTDVDQGENNNMNMIAQVAEANREKVDVFVSLHCDYYKAPSGTMALYCPGSAEGKKLAACLNDAVKTGMKMKTRGVIARGDLYELKQTDMTACVFECGSIRYDQKKFRKADRYGKYLAKGLCKYLGIKLVTKAAKETPAGKKYTGKLPGRTVGINRQHKGATKRWQKFLNWAIDAGLEEDGDFGEKTDKATKQFQKLVGLEKDGVVKKATRKAAKAHRK